MKLIEILALKKPKKKLPERIFFQLWLSMRRGLLQPRY